MIIDATMFYNEVDLLEIRLKELDPYVDHFVVIDATESHSSNEFRESKLKRFRHSKLHKVTLPILIPLYKEPEDAMKREHYQRDALWPHIMAIASSTGDLLMLSDVDELPYMDTVLSQEWWHHGLFVLEQDMYYYNPTNYVGKWHGTVVGTIESFEKKGSLQTARHRAEPIPVVPNGGWHFSYFGGVSRIREKVKNFSHSDAFSCIDHKTDGELRADMEAGRDLFNRPEIQGTYRPLGDHLPASMRNL